MAASKNRQLIGIFALLLLGGVVVTGDRITATRQQINNVLLTRSLVASSDAVKRETASDASAASKNLTVGLLDKLKYYWSKIPEAGLVLSSRGQEMISAGLNAQRMKKNTRMQVVLLKDIKLYHPVTDDGPTKKTNMRKEILLEHYNDITIDQENGIPFSPSIYNKLLPSIDPIQMVVYDTNDDGSVKNYLAIQGQGRLKAMKMAFSPDFKLLVEVSDLDKADKDRLRSVRNKYIEDGELDDNE
ncbi:MAG: hypothetical protein HQK53_07795 [Oligoflexia bacterium]|nr:hypothetical protein [Oligoflexia bacterium]